MTCTSHEQSAPAEEPTSSKGYVRFYRPEEHAGVDFDMQALMARRYQETVTKMAEAALERMQQQNGETQPPASQ